MFDLIELSQKTSTDTIIKFLKHSFSIKRRKCDVIDDFDECVLEERIRISKHGSLTIMKQLTLKTISLV